MHYGKVSECTDLKVDRDDNTAKVTVKGVGDVWRLGFDEQSMHDIARHALGFDMLRSCPHVRTCI